MNTNELINELVTALKRCTRANPAPEDYVAAGRALTAFSEWRKYPPTPVSDVTAERMYMIRKLDSVRSVYAAYEAEIRLLRNKLRDGYDAAGWKGFAFGAGSVFVITIVVNLLT